MASQNETPVPSAVIASATTLARQIKESFDEGSLHNNDFMRSLAMLRCVPVHLPATAHRLEDQGIYVTDSGGGRQSWNGGNGRRGASEATAEEPWSGGVALALYSEAAVPKDSNLVFTAQPVMMEGLVPPQVG